MRLSRQSFLIFCRLRDVAAGSLGAQPLQPVASDSSPAQLGRRCGGRRRRRRLGSATAGVIVVVLRRRLCPVELQARLCQQLLEYAADVDVILRRYLPRCTHTHTLIRNAVPSSRVIFFDSPQTVFEGFFSKLCEEWVAPIVTGTGLIATVPSVNYYY